MKLLLARTVDRFMNDLRSLYRRKVDYDDAVPGLSGIALIAIRMSEKVISDLSSL